MAGVVRNSPASIAPTPRTTPPSFASGTQQVKLRREASRVSVKDASVAQGADGFVRNAGNGRLELAGKGSDRTRRSDRSR